MTIASRRRALMGVQNKARLPAEYQEVEWIGSSGTQAIAMTGKIHYTDNVHYRIEFEAALTSPAPGATRVMCCINSAAPMWLGEINSGQNVSVGGGISFENIDVSQYHTYSMSWPSLLTINAVCDGTQTITRTVPSVTVQDDRPIGLFAECNSNGGSNLGSGMKAKWAKIWHDNTLIHHFIPCVRKSDNKIGMFDLVDNDFKTNFGTGSFSKGANV